MSMNRRAVLASLVALPLVPRLALAGEPMVFQTNGVAINGADPVAYFKAAKADTTGNSHRVVWHGAEWHFDSKATMTAFEGDPERFAPKFGGYCAYAASQGYLAPTIPEAWTVYEGRLYLNASLRAQELWRQDIPGNIAKANANWPKILG
ncbi:YHS domain-containing (seleno)protein [Marinovum sp. 2_MG-2023]|uniref:YHS domain-containing (seleno)protein n=1 Tax=unclassified Marinovum TaxID=2647166 RepID=UPI0026E267B3|nr:MULTISPECIES: YHS domain-containing (seleno)protein [unclassified Marinovum]MDO6728713.1 YHS domain-containing (seleno)protein [Marinovum sp. 2_MG-2023]MDO6777871.1 YHS domain-containing (seleno)protein [Marinovum sp. 1_MG-2023]